MCPHGTNDGNTAPEVPPAAAKNRATLRQYNPSKPLPTSYFTDAPKSRVVIKCPSTGQPPAGKADIMFSLCCLDLLPTHPGFTLSTGSPDQDIYGYPLDMIIPVLQILTVPKTSGLQPYLARDCREDEEASYDPVYATRVDTEQPGGFYLPSGIYWWVYGCEYGLIDAYQMIDIDERLLPLYILFCRACTYSCKPSRESDVNKLRCTVMGDMPKPEIVRLIPISTKEWFGHNLPGLRKLVKAAAKDGSLAATKALTMDLMSPPPIDADPAIGPNTICLHFMVYLLMDCHELTLCAKTFDGGDTFQLVMVANQNNGGGLEFNNTVVQPHASIAPESLMVRLLLTFIGIIAPTWYDSAKLVPQRTSGTAPVELVHLSARNMAKRRNAKRKRAVNSDDKDFEEIDDDTDDSEASEESKQSHVRQRRAARTGYYGLLPDAPFVNNGDPEYDSDDERCLIRRPGSKGKFKSIWVPRSDV